MVHKLKIKNKKIVIGLIHLYPMPGTSIYSEGDYNKSIKKAKLDAQTLKEAGADGCLIQTVDKVYNTSDDTDYVKVSSLSVIANEVRKIVGKDFIIGIQIMFNCITPSIAVAKAVDANFVRCVSLIGKTSTTFGNINSDPIKILEYRNKIGANKIDLIGEVLGYHSNLSCDIDSILEKVRLLDSIGVRAVEIFHKEEKINNYIIREIKKTYPNITIVLGGGTTIDNVKSRLKYADAVLVGSCFQNNQWGGMINKNKVSEYITKVRQLEKEISIK